MAGCQRRTWVVFYPFPLLERNCRSQTYVHIMCLAFGVEILSFVSSKSWDWPLESGEIAVCDIQSRVKKNCPLSVSALSSEIHSALFFSPTKARLRTHKSLVLFVCLVLFLNYHLRSWGNTVLVYKAFLQAGARVKLTEPFIRITGLLVSSTSLCQN